MLVCSRHWTLVQAKRYLKRRRDVDEAVARGLARRRPRVLGHLPSGCWAGPPASFRPAQGAVSTNLRACSVYPLSMLHAHIAVLALCAFPRDRAHAACRVGQLTLQL